MKSGRFRFENSGGQTHHTNGGQARQKDWRVNLLLTLAYYFLYRLGCLD